MTRHTYQFEVFKANGKHKMKISHKIAQFTANTTNKIFLSVYNVCFATYLRLIISGMVYALIIQLIKGLSL